MKNITRAVNKSAKSAQDGFSLVELMVVVTIIGILAGVAVPKFQTFKARANQTEAKSGLSGLYLAVQAFEANYNELPAVAAAGDPAVLVTTQGAPLGFTLTGAKQKYTYSFVSSATPGTDGWAATASSISPMKSPAGVQSTDALRINTNKWLCSPFDAVTGTPAAVAVGQTASAGATAALECPQVGAAGVAPLVAVRNPAGFDAP